MDLVSRPEVDQRISKGGVRLGHLARFSLPETARNIQSAASSYEMYTFCIMIAVTDSHGR